MSKTNNIQLSILIITTPSRFDMSYKLYNDILEMVDDMDIEVLMVFDNKKRSIGAKREAAKNIAQGKYFCFCDSDDQFLSIKEIYKATLKDVDVITFKAECSNDDGSTYIVTQRLGNGVEHNTKDGKYLDCNRPPFPNCAWAKKFQAFQFPDVSYAEDWVWVEQCLKVAKTEHHINKVLFKYNYNPTITEASTDSNSAWVNPNSERVVKRCVVNLSTEKYWAGQDRLKQSIPNYDILTYQTEAQVGSPLHKDNNYAFKPYTFIKAYELGYRQILWLDASMLPIADLQPIFDIIDKDGYFFQDSGWPNSRWTNEKAKEYFGTDEGQMLSSGVLGLDLTNPLAYQFFDEWTQAMRDGIFNGDWLSHRHDQTAASLIAHKLGMKLQDGNTFFVYGKEDEPTISDKTVLLADGIC